MKTDCPNCDGAIIRLRSHRRRICSNNCGYNEAWELEENELPLLGNNRQKSKTNACNQQA